MSENRKRLTNQKTPLPLHGRCKGTVRCMTCPSSVTALCLGRCSMLMLFIGILAVLGHSEGAPTPRHKNMPTYVHDGNTCFKCGPGTYVVNHCTEDFSYSLCKSCPAGHYQSHRTQSTRCEPCLERCLHDVNMVIVQNCSAATNTKCECRPGYYLHIVDAYMSHHVCKQHKLCPHGQVIIKNGTSTSDNECAHCPDGQFYTINRQCSSCVDRNMTQLVPCHSTADIVCQSSHTTVSQNVSTSGSPPNHDGSEFILWPILVGVVMLILAIIIVVIVLCYCKRCTVEKETKSIELNDSSARPMLERSFSSSSTTSTSVPKHHRTLSSSSDASTVTVSATVSISFELKDRMAWTKEVFDLLSQRLSTDWKRFMRLLPGDRQHNNGIEVRCEQIVMDEPGNVREQIHKALSEWSRAHDDNIVKVDNILDTLKRLSDSSPVYEEVRGLCCKLAKEQKRNLLQRENSISEV